MKLRIIILAVSAFIVLLLAAGLFLPRKIEARHAIVLAASPEALFPYFNDLKKWTAWTARTPEHDPTLTLEYEGPASGPGQIVRWEGEQMGAGAIELLKSHPQGGVWYELTLDNAEITLSGAFEFEKTATGTRIIASQEGRLPFNPVFRFFGLFMEQWLTADLQRDLEKLSRIIGETGSATAPASGFYLPAPALAGIALRNRPPISCPMPMKE